MWRATCIPMCLAICSSIMYPFQTIIISLKSLQVCTTELLGVQRMFASSLKPISKPTCVYILREKSELMPFIAVITTWEVNMTRRIKAHFQSKSTFSHQISIGESAICVRSCSLCLFSETRWYHHSGTSKLYGLSNSCHFSVDKT